MMLTSTEQKQHKLENAIQPMATLELLHAITDPQADVGQSDRFDLWSIDSQTGELCREAINLEQDQLAGYLTDYQNTDRGTFRLFFATFHYPIIDGTVVIDALAKLSTWLNVKLPRQQRLRRSDRNEIARE